MSIQGEQSEESNVDSGVPQGTVLGPTLFSVYIDDLESEIERRKVDVLVKKFADDTKGAKVIRSPEDRDKMQTALDCLCDWAETWVMPSTTASARSCMWARKIPIMNIS